MAASPLPSARLEWVRCLAPTERDIAAILERPAKLWQCDPVDVLALAAGGRDRGGAPALSLEYIDAAYRADGRPAWFTVVAEIVRRDALSALGRHDEARAALTAARVALDAATIDLGDRVRLSGVIHARAGVSAVLVGDLDTATTELARSLDLVGDLDGVRAETLGVLALVAFLVGRVHDCRDLLEATPRGNDTAGLPAELARILVEVETGAIDRARSRVALARERGVGTEYFRLIVAVDSIVHEAAGRLDDALSALWELDGLGSGSGTLASNLGVASWLAVQSRRHQIAPALAALRQIDADAAHSVCPAAWRARLYLETGDSAKALAATAECLALGPSHAMRTLVYVLAVTAAAQVGLRDPEADATFARALDLAARSGLRRYIMTLPPGVLTELISRAAAAPLTAEAHRVVVELSTMLPPQPAEAPPSLSPRERLVLASLAEGQSLHVVAWQLSVSHNTVKSQARSIYRKLGVDSRAAAVERGRILGFVD